MSVPPLRTSPLQVGDLLAGRYLLLEAVDGSDTNADTNADTDGSTFRPAVLWRAHDEVLARPVAIRVLATPNNAAREAAQPFLDAAGRSGRLNHPGLARVYDAAQET